MSRLLLEAAALLAMLLALSAAAVSLNGCARTKYVVVPVLSGTGACECEWTRNDTVMCLSECTQADCRACAEALPPSKDAL